jgi:hypothetical protein
MLPKSADLAPFTAPYAADDAAIASELLGPARLSAEREAQHG